MPGAPLLPMTQAILTLNYIHVLVVAIGGFMIGWLWYSPVLFAKPWIREMKITDEMMQQAREDGMMKFFVLGFVFTFISTFGLAAILNAHRPTWWGGGALVGGFIGACIAGSRILNTSVWERRSFTLMAINFFHEVVLFAAQGAVLAVWR